MSIEFLAAWESRLRPLLTRLPPAMVVLVYSQGRGRFLKNLTRQPPRNAWVPEGQERILWGLRFRSPLLNAAGMFKQGEGYPLAARQGAGGYLAGTTTHHSRQGNRKRGVALPFVPYPRSGAASNWLGLPNPGHRRVAERLERLQRVDGCPVGASVGLSPDPQVAPEEKLEQLVGALSTYEAAGVDFLEINESCPNTENDPGGFEAMSERLAYVAEHFLGRRPRPLPVIAKLSCDTTLEDVDRVVGRLLELGLDGVNFGNTSVDYGRHRHQLVAGERRLYDHFTETFGGGVSGRPLKAASLRLASAAVEHQRRHPSKHEFHVIRTGGIETAADVRESLAAGISLCQWYSAYFEAFSRHGHRLYRQLYSEL